MTRRAAINQTGIAQRYPFLRDRENERSSLDRYCRLNTTGNSDIAAMSILPVVLICRTRACLPRRANHWFQSSRLASTRGAYRDRHGRWMRDAVGVSARKTGAADAYGQIVWS